MVRRYIYFHIVIYRIIQRWDLKKICNNFNTLSCQVAVLLDRTKPIVHLAGWNQVSSQANTKSTIPYIVNWRSHKQTSMLNPHNQTDYESHTTSTDRFLKHSQPPRLWLTISANGSLKCSPATFAIEVIISLNTCAIVEAWRACALARAAGMYPILWALSTPTKILQYAVQHQGPNASHVPVTVVHCGT